MRHLTKIKLSVMLGCGLWFGALVACSSEDSSSDPYESLADVVKVDPVTGDTIILHRDIDTVMHVTETGETTWVADTILIPEDTTLHWVGESALRITEISPLNLNWNDSEGDDGSWVEIYNAGTEPANLKGYSLVENLKAARKWVFGNEVIQPKKFRIVFCDKKDIPEVQGAGADTDTSHARTHTNWKMDKDSGTVYLIDPYYGIRDSVKYPTIQSGMSYGITDGSIWKFFDKPTPEAVNTNSTAYEGMAPKVDMSAIKSGFYKEVLTLNPPKSLPEGVKLRCTQNGSVPTSSSSEFNNPITISTNTVFRCAAFKEGTVTKDVITKTFFIGETVNMPVVAVTVDPSFFEKHYVKASTSGCGPDCAPAGLYEDVEFPVHVEYFDKGSSSKELAWEIDAGISLMGGWSRLEDKKSVAIVMREEYQEGWLHYPLFETRKSENDKYKGFNLRNNGNRFVSDYFADAMGGALLEGSGVDYQRSRQVVVFYNGKYYGIHDMRERFNKNFVESNYGIDASTVNMIKHLGKEITASNGTTADYEALLAFVAANDFSGANNASYATVKGLMDVGNFADYMAAEIYYHNGDWPNNNVRAWKAPDRLWKFMVYDLDHGFDWQWTVSGFSSSTNMFSWIKKGGNSGCTADVCFPTFYNKLILNPDFKRLFINHSAVMLQNYLTGARAESIVKTMAASMNANDIERDKEKYEGRRSDYGHFDTDGSKMAAWAKERDPVVWQQYESEFGTSGSATVTISSTGGIVLMEGMNLPGNTANSTNYSGKFFGGVQMELTAMPVGGTIFSGWSDGSTENPHLVTVTDGLTISATFK